MDLFQLFRIYILALFILRARGQPGKDRYCVIIDAGSSGSRVHIYRYTISGANRLPIVRQRGQVLKTKLALSTFVTHPDNSGDSLAPLIQYAEEQVPNDAQSETSIHLMATAGMRLLPSPDMQAILESCREKLLKSVFRFEKAWAAVLPGSSEGIYSFIAANYASGVLLQAAPDPAELLGVVELGGASLQVTFMASADVDKSGIYHVLAGPLDLTLFTHSFLGLGQDVAQQLSLQLAAETLAKPESLAQEEKRENNTASNSRQQVLDPCLPQGFDGTINGIRVSGGGYFSLCRQASSRLVAGNCSEQHCGLRGLHAPALSGKFLCIENLQYTAGFLGLPHKATMRELVEAAERVCAVPWSEMLKRYPSYEPEHLLNYCFGAAFGVALLHDGLGVNMDDESLLFTETITSLTGQPVVLDWTLGAMVVAASLGSSILNLDREFPFLGEGNASGGVANIASRQIRSRLPVVEIALVLVVLIAAAVFSLKFRRKRKHRRPRTRRTGVNGQGRDGCRIFNDWDSEEEADPGSPSKALPGGYTQTLGRRANTARPGDIEQGAD